MKILILILLIFSLFSFVFAQENSAKLLIKDQSRQFMQPVFSPDGSKIAFTQANYQGIWVMNSDGSNSQIITDELAAGYRLQWSYDSQLILSRVTRLDNKRRYHAVKVYDLQNKKSQQLTEFVSFMPGIPNWSALNNQIIYPDRKQLQTMDSGKRPEIQNNKINLVCFEYKNKLVVSSSEFTELKFLDPFPGSQYLNPAVSNDGQKITFEVVGGNLYVMNSDGSGLQDLGVGYAPRFSPDGAKIVFMITKDDGYRLTSSDIFTISTDGSGLKNITNTTDKIEMNPDWSPKTNIIVFDVMFEGAIYKIDLR